MQHGAVTTLYHVLSLHVCSHKALVWLRGERVREKESERGRQRERERERDRERKSERGREGGRDTEKEVNLKKGLCRSSLKTNGDEI